MYYPKLIIRNDVNYTNVFHLLGKRMKLAGVLNQVILHTHPNDLTFSTNRKKIKAISEVLEISPTQVYEHIRTLSDLGILFKASKGIFLVNKSIIQIDWSDTTKF